MLIQFSVKNFRSIQEEQTFSLVKSADKDHVGNYFDPEVAATPSLLHSATIYGANAAGKSNLIFALGIMREMVLKSASEGQTKDSFAVKPFLFDTATATQPSEFVATFVSEGVRYEYGFVADSIRIYEEWLAAYPNRRRQNWFQRAYDEQNDRYDYEMGSALTGQKSVWLKATRDNALFLSTAVQLNSQQLLPVFNWFDDTLKMAATKGWNPSYTANLCEQEESKSEVLAFLKAADFHIHDIELDKTPFSPETVSAEIPEEIRAQIIHRLKDKYILEVRTVHQTSSGERVSLSFEDESDGTRKFFGFTGPWIDSLKNGKVLVIDELHDSLHPKMVEYLVNLFHNPKTNPNNAQLVFTTHETSILNQDVFRRDQIWFCEKNENQATELFPLMDFSPKKGHRENLEAAYLSGRYGALPYVQKAIFLEE